MQFCRTFGWGVWRIWKQVGEIGVRFQDPCEREEEEEDL